MPLRLHPVTRQRLARFRAHRRGCAAFLFLLAAFFVSLFSDFLANDRPLAVRCRGRWTFPILRFHPENDYLQNGRLTPADFKALARSPLFDPSTGNRMIWPPIPFGPLEILSPGDIPLPPRATLVATPSLPVAAADLDPSGNILALRGDASAFGLATGAAPDLPPPVRLAIDSRFSNQPAPALDFPLPDGGPVLSLSPYAPRPAPPATVRLSWRRSLAPRTPLSATIPDFPDSPATLSAIDPATLPPGFPPPGTSGWTHDIRREQVRFPFRPVHSHPLGIDSGGRDVAARMLYALRTSLSFGFLLALATMALGTLVGAVQGYYAGKTDILGQRLVEIWESLPFLYVLILVGSLYGRGFGLLLFLYALFNWIGISYYMRAEFLRLRRAPFVEAARLAGLPARRILFRHILPNALTPIVTFLPFALVGAIGTLAALDYLGFGLPPPTPSWGELLAQAQEFPHAWWLVLYPAVALFLVMLAGVFVGEALRAAYDPAPTPRWQA